MKSDVDRWNAKYSSRRAEYHIAPDPLLEECAGLLSGKGAALDYASGTCDNALFLARLGYNSYAVDGSEKAIRIAKRRAYDNDLSLLGFVADLDRYPLPRERFEVVVIVRYLNRSRIENVKQSLKIRGFLFFKTFNTRFLTVKPSFPREYVLNDGELTEWFAGWHCIKTNDSRASHDTQSFWIGRRPDETDRL